MDLIPGEIYNYLEIIEKSHIVKTGRGRGRTYRSYYKCKCLLCGNETIVERNHIITGHTKSCGCFHKKTIAETGFKNHKYNEIVHVDIYIGIVLPNNKITWIDQEDYDLVKNNFWAENTSHVRSTVRGYISETEGVQLPLKLHRMIASRYVLLTSENIVHHINGNPFDNRKENLYICKDRAEHMYIHRNNLIVKSNLPKQPFYYPNGINYDYSVLV